MAPETHGEAIATVAASGNRSAVLAALTEQEATPSTIAEQSPLKLPHVSRALSELREVGLVELLVPEETRKGRLYGITEKGEAVADRLDLDPEVTNGE